MRVLIVDDALVFRSIVRRILEGIKGVSIAGTASNGRFALDLLKHQDVDLITLDMNMPELGGLDVLRALRSRGSSAKVLVFSSRTAHSAQETIEALQLGATDFIVKPEAESIEAGFEIISKQLVARVNAFMEGVNTVPALTSKPAPKVSAAKDLERFKPKAVVIASSTGGPVALEKVVSLLAKNVDIPVFIAQHMPPNFTSYMAGNLGKISGVNCREAINGELVAPGTIYVAPGDFHMRVMGDKDKPRIVLDQGERVNYVRPAADLLFASAARIYGPHLAAMVLTGMGSDGAAGSVAVKEAGGCVMIQDRESSVVWGMPGAVYDTGAYDKIGDLLMCSVVLKKWCG